MDQQVVLVSMSASSASLACFAFGVVFLVLRSKKKSRGLGGLGGAGPTGSGVLPGTPMQIPDLTKKNVPPWNVLGTTGGGKIESDGQTIKISIRKNAVGMASGAQFKAVPVGLPALSATLGYSVYFPPDFVWAEATKLPGMCLGSSGTSCATGGNWSETAGSARVVQRENGQGIGYLYLALPGGPAKSYAIQSSDFKACSDPSKGTTGQHIFFSKCKGFQFKLGAWNDVTISVTMNTPATASNGILSLTVNEVTKTLSSVKWRASEAVKVCSVEFVSFAGGSDEASKKPRDTYVQFKNLRFAAK